MRVISPSFDIVTPIDREAVYRHIELCGRVCYKSEGNVTEGSAERLIRSMLARGHESPIEHYSVSVRIITDRGVSHEWVRHRLASYSQESTRYCNYQKNKFGNTITFIQPCFWEPESPVFKEWEKSCRVAEAQYFRLLGEDAKPERARAVLPNSTKTELVMTGTLRHWKHFFDLRALAKTGEPHPQAKEVALPLCEWFCNQWPEVFLDE